MGYRLAWQDSEGAGQSPDEADQRELLTLVSNGSLDAKAGLFFVDASAELLSAAGLQTASTQTTVLVLKQGSLGAEDPVALAASLRERGFGLALTDVDFTFLKTNGPLLSHVGHVLVCFDHPELQEICNYAKHRPAPFAVVVCDIPSWQALEDCAALGACGLFTNLCMAPRQIGLPAKLGPQAQQILQLMQMVQGNADIRQLEKVLKSDVALSYKLLRYINSAGFGLEVEIESPRHAVAMLGYAPLFRWLLLLLARTNAKAFSPALMQAAMVRGRFAELLGQGFLSRREAENLFVVGMFSSLDRLLGIPIHEVLRQLVLPEAVTQALLSREGIYGPVLALAEASERKEGDASGLAEALSMTPMHVNQAHLSALAWAQSIKL